MINKDYYTQKHKFHSNSVFFPKVDCCLLILLRQYNSKAPNYLERNLCALLYARRVRFFRNKFINNPAKKSS